MLSLNSRAPVRGLATLATVTLVAGLAGTSYAAGRPPHPAVLPISAVAATAVASTGGPALAWGDNAYGELGDGTTNQAITPIPVALPSGTSVTEVAAGVSFSLALTSAGTVLAWGNNSGGQLGNGTTTSSLTPVAVSLPAGTVVTHIAAGAYSGYALTATGAVYGWGDDTVGELGDGAPASTVLTPVAADLPSGTVVTQFSAGSSSVLARTSTGGALAWGNNFSGQLGNGSTTLSATPVAVALPSGTSVSAVAARSSNGFAITSSGGVLAWGADNVGQLGNGTTGGNETTPVAVALPGGATVTRVAAGGGFALALTSGGNLLSWGGGGHGDLGNGGTANSSSPVAVSLPSGVTAAAISAGTGYAVITTTNGRAYSWGLGDYGQLGNGSTSDSDAPVPVSLATGTMVSQVAAGQGVHTLAVAMPPPAVAGVTPASGVKYASGSTVQISGSHFANATAVHFGTKAAHFTVVADDAITATVPAGTGTVDVTVTTLAGTSPTMPLDRYSYLVNCSVLGWGYGYNGQIGDGFGGTTYYQVANPVTASVLSGTTWKAVATGDLASYGITTTGAVYAWGDNSYGELGNGTQTSSLTPVRVALPAGVVATAVVASDEDAYALTSTGQVYAWGYNGSGEDGNGTTTQNNSPVKVKLSNTVKVTQLSTGYATVLARTSTGKVYAWGYNGYGEIGDGTTVDRSTPVLVHIPAGVSISQVSAGYYHNLAKTSTGAALAWGANETGELGDGTTTMRLLPVTVGLPAGTRVAQVAANYLFSVALTTTGVVLGWGDNTYGQLGDGTTTRHLLPAAALLPNGVRINTLAADYYSTLGLARDGAVYGTGYNGFGDLGTGDFTNRTTFSPVALPAGTAVTRLAAYGDTALVQLTTTPAVLSVQPGSGSVAGGSSVTITGRLLQGATRVMFGSTPAASFTVSSSDTIIAVAPAHAAGRVDVRVTTPAGTSPARTDSYTFH